MERFAQRPLRASAQASRSSPSIDGRAAARRTGANERLPEANPVVDLELRELEVGAHAVGVQETIDVADERVLRPAPPSAAGGRENVA